MQPSIAFDNSYAQLPERFFARLEPRPVRKPGLIALNDELARNLNLDPDDLRSTQGVAWLAGNARLEGSEPLAMAYAGQQFGNWVPQLGDGRALLLGEVIDQAGLRRDIQLKGSGPTPFSRMGDGRAWLGPVLREYIVSEAMHALGVPTTRALAAVSTGEEVIREEVFPGAILTRVSLSHIRVGTFQYFAVRGDMEALRQLADYAIDRLYPQHQQSENRYLELLNSVIEAQASLVARWMNIGFIHGVMNTDNVSIAGETIDYGPCAFMDDFHPDRVFSSIDEAGRYAYANQPKIAQWNIVQLAQALLPLLDENEDRAVELAQAAVNAFPAMYSRHYEQGLNAKLGLDEVRDGDGALANSLLTQMTQHCADFTLAFRYLTENKLDEFTALFANSAEIGDWLEQWQKRCEASGQSAEQCRAVMLRANPAFIPRNHRIEQCIGAALESDFQPFERLVRVLKTPFDGQAEEAELMLGPQPEEVVPYTFCGT